MTGSRKALKTLLRGRPSIFHDRARVGGIAVLLAVTAGTAAMLLARPSAGAFAAAPANAPPPRYYGVNLPSASFASNRKPGVAGKDYIYPTRKIAAPFAAMGMNSVRLSILWERIQPQPLGPMDDKELKRLDDSIAALSDFDTVIVDIHNYGRYGGVTLDRQPAALLPDLWTKLAAHFKAQPRVAFGIMNEPHDIDAADWRRISEASVAAVRRTGAHNLVLVPGTNWTGGHSWNRGGASSNAKVMSGFADPGRNFLFEVHQYLDSDSSGTKNECSGRDTGSRRLANVTAWLREHRARAMLAEFGVPPTPTCLAALDDLMTYLRANGDVWAGWTYWAAGDWWKNYPMNIQPQGGAVRPQAEILARSIAGYGRSLER